jgi:hypothetical protein
MSTPLPFQKGELYQGFMDKIRKKGLARTNDFYVKIDINDYLSRIPFQRRESFTNDDKRQISFMCKSATLPKLAIATEDFVEKPSVVSKIARIREESQVFPMTFYCTPDLWERKFFEKWMDFVIDPKTYTPNYYEEYAKNNNITLFILPKTFSGQMVMENFIDYISTVDLRSAFNGTQNDGSSVQSSIFGNSQNTFSEIGQVRGRKAAGSGQPIYYVKFFECYPISISEIALSNENNTIMEFNVEMSYKYFQSITDLEFSPLRDDVL